jgi:hypothetical protein
VKNILGRPGALPTHVDRAGLRLGNHGSRHGACGYGGTLEQVAAAWGFAVSHALSPVVIKELVLHRFHCEFSLAKPQVRTPAKSTFPN